MAVGQLAGGRP